MSGLKVCRDARFASKSKGKFINLEPLVKAALSFSFEISNSKKKISNQHINKSSHHQISTLFQLTNFQFLKFYSLKIAYTQTDFVHIVPRNPRVALELVHE